MNLTKTLLAAGVFAIFGGAGFAATVNPDDLLGGANLPNSGDGTELAAMCAMIGIPAGDCATTLEIDEKPLTGLTIQVDDVDDSVFYVDIAPSMPGWFLLKFGDAGGSIYTHFFFENLSLLNILAWDIDDPSFAGTELAKAWHDCGVGDTVGGNCTLSHITTFVPIPAAGWLLIGGLGGLVALRRRKS